MKKRQATGWRDALRFKRLYKRAFPICERKPFSIIKKMQKKGKSDIWLYEEDGKFVGMASTINGENAVLVDYLAVEEKMRGKGVGRRILLDLKAHYGADRLFLEIESPDTVCRNPEERRGRKRFYLDKCGMLEMGVTVNIFGTDMELLSYGLRMTYEEYREFYRANYSEYAALHISHATGLPSPNTKRRK